MTDHQQKSVSRSMTPKTPSANPFKKGDIVWVVYRKSINWPAKVTAYYPKVRKVSYVFLPLKEKNAVFKTDPAKVQLFTLDDQLPENAALDLEESFEQARRLLQGVPEEEIIAENVRKDEEKAAQMTPKKKALTMADALKKSTGSAKGTPKGHFQQQEKNVPKESIFKQGDPIIVDTPMGMWPGMFISYVKNDPLTVYYSLFPREEYSHEVVQTSVEAIIPFPPEQIDQAIEDGRTSNSEVLLAALQDVQKYMSELGRSGNNSATGASATSTSTVLGTPLAAPGRDLVKEKKPKKQAPKVELTPPREAKAQPRTSLNSRLSSRVGDEECVAPPTPPVPKSKKRTASQVFREPVDDIPSDIPSAGPVVKRLKEDDTTNGSDDVVKESDDTVKESDDIVKESGDKINGNDDVGKESDNTEEVDDDDDDTTA